MKNMQRHFYLQSFLENVLFAVPELDLITALFIKSVFPGPERNITESFFLGQRFKIFHQPLGDALPAVLFMTGHKSNDQASLIFRSSQHSRNHMAILHGVNQRLQTVLPSFAPGIISIQFVVPFPKHPIAQFQHLLKFFFAISKQNRHSIKRSVVIATARIIWTTSM